LAAPAFAARVEISNLLPAGAEPTQVKTDASGNVYVGGNYVPPDGSSDGNTKFVAKISADGSKLIYFSQGGGVGYGGSFGYLYLGSLAIASDGSVRAYVTSGGEADSVSR
jgi:hypothetical protein